MSRILPVTVLVAVRNEAPNLAKCLKALTRAQKVIVIDSNSTDGTAEIAVQLGATVLQFQYRGTYPKKRQWAIDHADITTGWILLVDADEEVTPELWDEIEAAIQSRDHAAYFVTKSFHFLGRRLRFGGFSFASILLFKRGTARFEETLAESTSGLDMEVHERLIVEGSVGRLRSPIIHNDFKNLQAFVDRHNKYSTWEAELRHKFLTTGRYGEKRVSSKLLGNTQEFRRAVKSVVMRMPFEASLWWSYHIIFRLGFLEGRRGWEAARIRANYINDVRAKLYERKLGERGHTG